MFNFLLFCCDHVLIIRLFWLYLYIYIKIIIMHTPLFELSVDLVAHFLYSEFSVFTILMHAFLCDFSYMNMLRGHVY